MYLSSIVAANLLVAKFGPGVSIVTAFLAIGFSITGRDVLHEAWRGAHLKRNLGLLMLAGSAITVLTNRDAAQIAIASTVAFAVSMLVDSAVYHVSGSVVYSNLTSAAVDSVLFPSLAFGVLLPWVILGQFAAKFVGGAVWLLLLVAINRFIQRLKLAGWMCQRWR